MARSARSPRRRGFTLSRVAALCVIVLMAALYAGPVQKELRVGTELGAARRQVQALQREQQRLRARMDLLQSPQGEFDLARSCGYALPGERPLVVQGQASTCGGGG